MSLIRRDLTCGEHDIEGTATADKTRKTHVQRRGNYLDLGAEVTPVGQKTGRDRAVKVIAMADMRPDRLAGAQPGQRELGVLAIGLVQFRRVDMQELDVP